MDSGTIWGIVGTVIGVAGIVVALVFAKWRRFMYARRGNTVVVNYKTKLKALSVLYNGKEAESLTITMIAFWNHGNDTISRSDISRLRPLVVDVIDGVEILDVIPIFTSSDACGISVRRKKSEKTYIIDFDYLDPRKGGVLQVIHTGKTPESVWVDGEIKGVKKVKMFKERATTRFFAFVLLCIGLALIGAAILVIFDLKREVVGAYLTFFSGLGFYLTATQTFTEDFAIPKEMRRLLNKRPLETN